VKGENVNLKNCAQEDRERERKREFEKKPYSGSTEKSGSDLTSFRRPKRKKGGGGKNPIKWGGKDTNLNALGAAEKKEGMTCSR